MEPLIIGVLLVFVALLILVMFLFLKKTVAKINQQSKDYFVDKLQAYDNLIKEREEKLQGLNKDIEEKQKELEAEVQRPEVNSKVYLYDMKNIDFQDEKIFTKMKEVDQRFNIDTVKLIKRFLKEHFQDDTVLEYNKYMRVRDLFDQKMIFRLISLRPSEQEKEVKELLRDLAYLVDDFKKKNKKFEVKRFISYFDDIISKVDPYVYVYVGTKDENYDSIDKFIRTKIDKNIYRGVSIVYKSKLYDYSLK
ncbi:MAG: hypothetical protein IJ193_04705 [Bacilli bacterium]|nr:hypothetical protein [Bacilli bacterium]